MSGRIWIRKKKLKPYFCPKIFSKSDSDPPEVSLNLVNSTSDPVNLNPDPVNLNPDPVNLNTDPVNLNPDPKPWLLYYISPVHRPEEQWRAQGAQMLAPGLPPSSCLFHNKW